MITRLCVLLAFCQLFPTTTAKFDPDLICGLAKDAGPCQAMMPRYHFDTNTWQCRRFIYGGCGGNGNNFRTLGECKSTCISSNAEPLNSVISKTRWNSVSTDPSVFCFLEQDPGSCRDYLPRFYFDQYSMTCKTFFYGGCAGNLNRFLSYSDCLANCIDVKKDTASIQKEIQVTFGNINKTDDCLKPKDRGPCIFFFPQYYYDDNSKQCHPFIYGGCGGNSNRFTSRAACLSKCQRTAPIEEVHSPMYISNDYLPTVAYSRHFSELEGSCEFDEPMYTLVKDEATLENCAHECLEMSGCFGFVMHDKLVKRCDLMVSSCEHPVDFDPQIRYWQLKSGIL